MLLLRMISQQGIVVVLYVTSYTRNPITLHSCFRTGRAFVVEMLIVGRWKSSQMLAHYAKLELAERGTIARYKENKSD